MPDRITPYQADGKVTDRIDEIFVEHPSAIHIEAMSSVRSFLLIGEQRFWIEVQGKDLVIRKEV